MLDQALKHGLILEKVHLVIEFDQLESYIDFNTKQRAKAKNYFEKNFYKLMKNALLSKTTEDIRKHRNIKLAITYDRFRKLSVKPIYKSQTKFGEDFYACEMGKIKVVINKLVYLGQAILDLSKIIMYKFHYDYMQPNYKNNPKLCYMNTDSFIYFIYTEDFYTDIAPDVKDWFVTSNYNPADTRPLPIGLNKKVVGLIKDSLEGRSRWDSQD